MRDRRPLETEPPRPRRRYPPAGRGDGRQQARLASYSRRVRAMKILLPLLALGVVGAIFLAGEDRGDVSRILSAEEIARLSAGLKLEAPTFTGRTEAGEPFRVTADWAEPDGTMPNRVDLVRPEGELLMSDGRVLTGEAARGRLLRDEERLTLMGGVVIVTSDGYRFETERLTLDTGSQTAEAATPVRGTGPEGEITAGSMRIVPAEAEGSADGSDATNIWFENGVRVVFSPDGAARGASGPDRSGGAPDAAIKEGG